MFRINLTPLNQQGISLTIDTFLGLAGLVTAFGLYFFDLRKKIDELLLRSEGVLTKIQAHQLTDLYLDAIQTHFTIAFNRYANNEFPRQYEQGDLASIMHEIQSAYKTIVIKSLRPMVASFRVRGNITFSELIADVSQISLTKAFEKVEEHLSISMSNRVPFDKCLVGISKILLRTGESGKDLIVDRIDRLYPVST
jgi:hypothetical protein